MSGKFELPEAHRVFMYVIDSLSLTSFCKYAIIEQKNGGLFVEEFEALTLPTYIKPGLDIVFCGINPGRISALKGYHFANPANLFWKGLYMGGITPYQFKPEETEKLLDYGYGITDIVGRATRSSSDLKKEDFVEGAAELRKLIRKYKPKCLCFIGITAFRHATNRQKDRIVPGLQDGLFYSTEEWAGCHIFVVPSTSGANAHYTREERIDYFRQLNEWNNLQK